MGMENLAYLIDFDTPHRFGELREEGDDSNQWLKSTDNVYSSCKDTSIVNKLEAGTYCVFQDSRGACHAQKFELETEELYYLPDTDITDVVEEVARFWERKDLFKQHKITHKRGILFKGPPGTGKTSLLNLLAASLIKNDGLVFFISDRDEFFWFVQFANEHLRKIEPNRPIITIIEDIDKFVDGGATESAMLSFLDGPDSVNHNIVIATTNRPDELNDLILRPCRFDWHIEVNVPTLATRKFFLEKKGLDADVIDKWVKDTKDFSFAELKELFSAVILLDNDYNATLKKLKDQGDAIQNTTFKPKHKSSAIGFGVKK